MAQSHERKELKANWKNTVDAKVFSKKEVAKHASKQDNWIVVHGKVYDVTEYQRDHPGGLDILLEIAGTDATSAYEDVGHSDDAGEIMHDLLVGVLEGASTEEESSDNGSSKSTTHITIRRHEKAAPSAFKKTLLDPRVEFAVGLVATTSLTYLVNRYHLLQALDNLARDSGIQVHHTSFTRGFLTASTVVGAASTLGVRYLAGTSNKVQPHPAHLQSTSLKATEFHPAGVLRQSEYQKFKLRDKEMLSDGIYRFTFDLPTKYSVLGLPIGQHVAIKAEIDDHSVVRSYTPVSNNRDLGRLVLLIRVYPDGRMGNYLKDLEVGEIAEIRGPKGAMKYRRAMSKHIGMIGGGTGITPLFQLIRAICEDDNDDTKISLVYGNRSETDIMLREKLDKYARDVPHKFKLHYILSQAPPKWINGKGQVTKELLKEKMPEPSPGTKILLCGPPGMVNAMKNNLIELGFEAPGALSKMTDQIFCF